MITASEEIDRLSDKSTALFVQALIELGKASNAVYEYPALTKARADFQELLANTMILADLMGRKRAWMEFDKAVRAKHFAQDATPIQPNLTFNEAVKDLLAREPRLAKGYKAVQELYRSDYAFALAKSAEEQVTKKVQEVLATAVEEGRSINETGELIMQIGDWTRAYADTVYRTNMNTAYTTGRMEQASDPDIEEAMPAFRFVSINDAATRPNHRALHGTVDSVRSPLWNRISPPLSWNCRCALDLTSRFDLERMGLWDATNKRVVQFLPPSFYQGGPDPGFGSDKPGFLKYLG